MRTKKKDIVATGVGLAIDDKKNEITYFKCSKIGHYDREYPGGNNNNSNGNRSITVTEK